MRSGAHVIPGSAAAHIDRWPVGKIPVLHDFAAGRTIPETSIIIEYLQEHYPGRLKLLPDDSELLLQVRLWDRFYDLHVSQPMQKVVIDRIRPEGAKDAHGVAEARASLDQAYAMIESQMTGQTWAVGDEFSMADCAALPALFFASIVQPFEPDQQQLAGYLDRLHDWPSVRRVIGEAQPYFSMFPYRDAMPQRYLEIGLWMRRYPSVPTGVSSPGRSLSPRLYRAAIPGAGLGFRAGGAGVGRTARSAEAPENS